MFSVEPGASNTGLGTVSATTHVQSQRQGCVWIQATPGPLYGQCCWGWGLLSDGSLELLHFLATPEI